MKRNEIIEELKTYFDIRELVCSHTYKAFGERSWQFLDTEYLHNLLILRRDIFKAKMSCNNWYRVQSGQTFDERGLRCNICDIVKGKTSKGLIYLSAHVNGAAGDFDVDGFTAEESRKIIYAHQNLLAYPIRLESNVSWLHFDCYDYNNGKLVNYF